MKDMKKIVMIIMAVALIALPTMAQQQEWKSTSTMQGAGSTLSPNVQQVGAVHVPSMATTTSQSYSPAKAPGMRREEGLPTGGDQTQTDPGDTTDTSSPIGDAMLPLMLMAVAFGAYVALRRKRTALNS